MTWSGFELPSTFSTFSPSFDIKRIFGMEDLVRSYDAVGLKAYIKAETEKGLEEELVISRVDRLIRELGFELIDGSSPEVLQQKVAHHFTQITKLAAVGVCTRLIALTSVQDILETSSIRQCEKVFSVIETNLNSILASATTMDVRNLVLRMCNDLLKRLSQTADTSFCGRILFFLSRFMPFDDKSGINLTSAFNLQNVTHYEKEETETSSLIAPPTVVDEDIESGEIKESKDNTIPVDHELYLSFWQLQDFFVNPTICYDKTKWSTFIKSISDVFGLFSTYRLERERNEDDNRKTRKNNDKDAEMEVDKAFTSSEQNAYFAKYLTSPKLLQLQLNDSQFRRYFLLQCLIIFQYLTSEVKFKMTGKNRLILNEDQLRVVYENVDKAYKLLRDTHPRGSSFSDGVRKILRRDLDWSQWKNNGCKPITEHNDGKPMALYKKRPRVCYDPSVPEMGTDYMTTLWKMPETSFLAACRNRKEKVIPKLEDFIRDPILELDPEQQVDDEYKAINQPYFQFCASRYLLRESPYALLKREDSKRRTIKMSQWLENVILNTGKNLDEFKHDLAEREMRMTRKLAEESMKKKIGAKEGSNSPGPDAALSDEGISELAEILGKDFKELAEAVEFSQDKVEELMKLDDQTEICKAILSDWSLANNQSVRKLQNILLVAELLSDEVVQKKTVKRKFEQNKKARDGDDKEAQLSRRKRIMAATEIESDQEDSAEELQQASGASEDEYEEVHDKGYKQAKKLLDKLQTETAADEDEMAEKLKIDALEKAGKLQRAIADKAELDDEREISYRKHRFSPLCVAFSPDGKFIVSSGKESSIVKYNLQTRRVAGVIRKSKKNPAENEPKSHYGQITAVAISPDGKYLASGGQDGLVKIWNFSTLEHLRNLHSHRDSITSLCFQQLSTNLFSASKDKTVKMWDVEQTACFDTMFGHFDCVTDLAVLQKPRVVTAGGRDRTCRVWKVEAESQLLFDGLQSHCMSLDCVAMINDEHFASGSADGTLAIWSIWKKKPLCVRKQVHGIGSNGEPRWVISIAAVQYSDLVSTGSNEGRVLLWKLAADRKSLFQVYAYDMAGFINRIAFSQDGRLMALAVGQEHKEGRWWIDKTARNQVVVIPIYYSEEDKKKAVEENNEKEGDGMDGIEESDSAQEDEL
ncbi:hypothetical protein WR25_07316 [Diploscapter pachys]|uniref:Death domain-containing protein n=1 Tax=Diploscapter pachys TaxID=2018661 RepID=A0A2A2LIL4_9BILA|nr:hypothetical protein WR25_07316 [Diploscapter pachys]